MCTANGLCNSEFLFYTGVEKKVMFLITESYSGTRGKIETFDAFYN